MSMLTARKPLCSSDGNVDFTLFGAGLFADGDSSCAVCLSTMDHGAPVALLPCGHQLHPSCVKELEAHRESDSKQPKLLVSRTVVEQCTLACPLCRMNITGSAQRNVAHHSMPSAYRLHQRFLEYIRTGMCINCQLKYLEQNLFASEVIVTKDGPAVSYTTTTRAHHTQGYSNRRLARATATAVSCFSPCV